eukprot:CAMPEP_0198296684 /NCGR_PEP_ID=MMETSP1449-20131203/33518_1 /TAXON_ID=420275 /ORGANISM="Attheya septentrionalis, Strain CCMP2084" /LENGTH=497 /DNA_ID=CAMNT_0043997363 /DNA_START=135 /DNA_END=1626 /DNA_ORIENTATION=-
MVVCVSAARVKQTVRSLQSSSGGVNNRGGANNNIPIHIRPFDPLSNVEDADRLLQKYNNKNAQKGRDPTATPTATPTTATPTTATPTLSPTNHPTNAPTLAPTPLPTATPSANPTVVASSQPSASPSGSPTMAPTEIPDIVVRLSVLMKERLDEEGNPLPPITATSFFNGDEEVLNLSLGILETVSRSVCSDIGLTVFLNGLEGEQNVCSKFAQDGNSVRKLLRHYHTEEAMGDLTKAWATLIIEPKMALEELSDRITTVPMPQGVSKNVQYIMIGISFKIRELGPLFYDLSTDQTSPSQELELFVQHVVDDYIHAGTFTQALSNEYENVLEVSVLGLETTTFQQALVPKVAEIVVPRFGSTRLMGVLLLFFCIGFVSYLVSRASERKVERLWLLNKAPKSFLVSHEGVDEMLASSKPKINSTSPEMTKDQTLEPSQRSGGNKDASPFVHSPPNTTNMETFQDCEEEEEQFSDHNPKNNSPPLTFADTRKSHSLGPS